MGPRGPSWSREELAELEAGVQAHGDSAAARRAIVADPAFPRLARVTPKMLGDKLKRLRKSGSCAWAEISASRSRRPKRLRRPSLLVRQLPMGLY
jgi:hypothetical protein